MPARSTPARTAGRAGRPTAERAEAIDRAILAAGKDLFLSVGFSATLMEAVAAAAGVSKGALYARYPTKDALLQAVVADRLAVWSEEARAREGPLPDEPRARLALLTWSLQRSLASDEIQAFTRILAQGADAGGQLMRDVYEGGYMAGVRSLRDSILHAAKESPSPPRDATRVAEMLMAMMIGWRQATGLIRPISEDEAKAYAEHAVDVVLGGRAAW
ncbi:MAG: hypothetical protein BGN86_15450 [Caulobacterales bacterium 68-7]|nr:MAG: hypothetical protein BGN86_15450 [Caulobacterales bacterium 68-7]